MAGRPDRAARIAANTVASAFEMKRRLRLGRPHPTSTGPRPSRLPGAMAATSPRTRAAARGPLHLALLGVSPDRPLCAALSAAGPWPALPQTACHAGGLLGIPPFGPLRRPRPLCDRLSQKRLHRLAPCMQLMGGPHKVSKALSGGQQLRGGRRWTWSAEA